MVGVGLTEVAEFATEEFADKGEDDDLEHEFELVYLFVPFALQS